MAQDFIPVLYNIGLNAKGDCYNLNSNQIARQLCLDLDIEKLFFIRAKEALPTTQLTIPPGAQVHPNGKIFSNINLDHVETQFSRPIKAAWTMKTRNCLTMQRR